LCGANLDPGEICDCTKKAAPGEQIPEAANGKYPFHILTNKGDFVND
jgi:hypothetical protein